MLGILGGEGKQDDKQNAVERIGEVFGRHGL